MDEREATRVSSSGAGIIACGNGQQNQQGMGEQDAISSNAGVQAFENWEVNKDENSECEISRGHKQAAGAAESNHVKKDAISFSAVIYAGVVGPGISYTAGIRACEHEKAQVETNLLIRSNAGINACEKDKQRQQGMDEPNAISSNAGINACEKEQHRQQGMGAPDTIRSSGGINACEKGRPDDVSYHAGTAVCEKHAEAPVETPVRTDVISYVVGESSLAKRASDIRTANSYSAEIREFEDGKVKSEPHPSNSNYLSTSSHSPENSECEKSEAQSQPDVISYSAEIRARETCHVQPELSASEHLSEHSTSEKLEATTESNMISSSLRHLFFEAAALSMRHDECLTAHVFSTLLQMLGAKGFEAEPFVRALCDNEDAFDQVWDLIEHAGESEEGEDDFLLDDIYDDFVSGSL